MSAGSLVLQTSGEPWATPSLIKGISQNLKIIPPAQFAGLQEGASA